MNRYTYIGLNKLIIQVGESFKAVNLKVKGSIRTVSEKPIADPKIPDQYWKTLPEGNNSDFELYKLIKPDLSSIGGDYLKEKLADSFIAIVVNSSSTPPVHDLSSEEDYESAKATFVDAYKLSGWSEDFILETNLQSQQAN